MTRLHGWVRQTCNKLRMYVSGRELRLVAEVSSAVQLSAIIELQIRIRLNTHFGTVIKLRSCRHACTLHLRMAAQSKLLIKIKQTSTDGLYTEFHCMLISLFKLRYVQIVNLQLIFGIWTIDQVDRNVCPPVFTMLLSLYSRASNNLSS